MSDRPTLVPGAADTGTSDNRPAENPAGWALESHPHISGLVTWAWHIPTNEVTYSREWRNVMLRPDDPSVETDLSSWWPQVHDDDVQPFLETARDIVEGLTENYQTLFRVQRADGTWAWLLSRGRVVEKDGDRPILVHGALMDISFLRQDVKFQHGHMGMSVPRYHAMPDDGHRQLPGGVRVFLDPTESPYPGQDPEQQEFVRERVRKVFAEGSALREMATFATEYGHNVSGEYFFWPEFGPDGRVTAVMSQFMDLTDRLLVERRARLNEMRLEALHQLTQMTAATEEEVLAFAMDSLVELTGSESGFLFFPHTRPGGKGTMVWSRNHHALLGEDELPVDSLPNELAELTTDDAGRPYQKVVRNGNCLQPVRVLFDGKMPLLRYIATQVFEGDRLICIAGVCNKENAEYREDDLHQLEAFVSGAWLVLRRHEFVRELQRTKEAAERANKVKDEFLANVSHELRTPLNGMLSMLQLLDLLSLNEQQREYVRTASISGKALLRIISDILDFSRIESGKMKLQIEPFDFRSAFESSLGLFAREAAKQGLGFEVSIDETIPAALLGDDARVRQILFNIVGNALKFTETGEIHVSCSLLPHGGPDHAWVYLAVRDTGIGIPQGEIARIFEAFTQIDSSTTRKYKGTGLGLSIVRHLVALMGGGITVESEVGEGTTVHCSLRFARVPEELDVTGPFEPPGEIEGEAPLRILVAEDDDVSRFALQSFLQRLGHRPVCASNGREALEMLQLCPFDCLFTDIQMPDMDGLELVRRVRDGLAGDVPPTDESRAILAAAIPGEYPDVFPLPRDIVAVTVSAHTMRGDRERFLNAGMDHYISKPIAVKELADVLHKVRATLKSRDH